jgi:uncharacterized protein
MTRFIAALIAMAACFPFSVAVAQEPAPADPAAQAPEVDPARLELAEELIVLSRSRDTFDAVLPNIADQVKTTLIRSNPQMQLGIIEIVDKVALDLVEKRADLDRVLARIWASVFEESELQDLVDFYSSETGKKFAERQPRLLAAQIGAAEAWGRTLSQEMLRQVQAQLRAASEAEARSLTGAAPAEGEAAPAAGQ